MIVKIESPGPLDVETFEPLKDGAAGIVSTPFFYDSGKEGTAAVVRVFAEDGELLSAARLTIDGASGKVRLQDRTAPTKARREQEKQEAAKTFAPVQPPYVPGTLPPLPAISTVSAKY